MHNSQCVNYPVGGDSTTGMAPVHSIEEIDELHDVKQNLRDGLSAHFGICV